jgi:hypothetical protein
VRSTAAELGGRLPSIGPVDELLDERAAAAKGDTNTRRPQAVVNRRTVRGWGCDSQLEPPSVPSGRRRAYFGNSSLGSPEWMMTNSSRARVAATYRRERSR